MQDAVEPGGTPLQSYWNLTGRPAEFPQFQGSAECDIAVVGGGMVGLTVAESLSREGLRVAVIEADRVGAQVTGRSTAKLTSLHGLIYADLIRVHGEKVARAYAAANQQALEYVAERAEALAIDCSLERAPAFTFSASGQGLAAIRSEVQAARVAGLAAEFVEQAPLPFEIAGAIRLDGQIQFHPKRYLDGLAAAVAGNGGLIFERTRALRLRKGRPNRILTDRGTVSAQQVVIATHMPFHDRALLFAKASPRFHVVLAVRIDEQSVPGGMFISTEVPSRSFRPHRDEYGPVLIVTGEGYRAGHAEVHELKDRLESYVRERFQVREIICWWTNEDYDSADRLPFAGRMTRRSHRLHTATGFSGWGLSNGTVAARLIADLVTGRRNPLAKALAPSRWNLRKSGMRLLHSNLHVGREFIADRLEAMRAPDAEELHRGEGGLVRHGGRVVAAFRDEEGRLHAFAPQCPHMRCLLAWNSAERIWNCSCHGSQFDCEGRMLHGPAVDDMERL